MPTKLKKGYVQIYTGNGKGKTTAALGLAFRAAGNDFHVFIGQFMKGQDYGELKAASRLAPYITIEQFGKPTFVHVDKATEEDVRLAKEGLEQSRKAMLSEAYDIVILDEINVAIFFKLVTTEEVLALIDEKPAGVELILTGRYAPKDLIEKADLVTEMKEVKHYYTQGVQARKGIEK
ncbi:MAG: cob(I)yrinic acid a,c-diamide adenosyltransferase [Calditrichaeota bacterium]|nr:cob(I)yrinic acid a,c-diamide adenosyltransferase [Calditrichota bacterium]